MNYEENPFQELYLSEGMDDEFVDLFSPIPLQSAINPLFQDSNVVLTGTQGCGKTMILQLLLPETRIAYHRARSDSDADTFPINQKLRRFISAGVNLTRSGICDIAGVTLGKGEDHDFSQLPYYFADFLNFWIVRDLLKTVRLVSDHPDVFEEICSLDDEAKLAACLVRQDCWNGALEGCTTLAEIEARIARRVGIYRRWVSQNELDQEARDELDRHKTTIGEPIARTADCLRTSKVLHDQVRVFIRVDQLEELHLSPLPRQHRLRLGFRHLLNRVFASRDRRVHYRVGTRRWGWNFPELLVVHGSGAKLEAKRDYIQIDLEDDLLARRENARGGEFFRRFADDAFRRRVAFTYKDRSLPEADVLARRVFGKSPSHSELADYVTKSRGEAPPADRVLGLDEHGDKDRWSPEWRSWLSDLYRDNPLDAVLAAAWGRQTGGGQGKREHRESPPPKPGEKWMKPWWRKERLDQAVLQLSARRAQRMLWWGYDDVIDLSGSNITAFLHICHKVWDLFLKAEGSKRPQKVRIDPIRGKKSIPHTIQSAGIDHASSVWNQKLGEQPGGEVRRRFIEILGKTLRKQLRHDSPMSYPGANGISLKRDDLETIKPELWRFLRDAVGYGDLHAVTHTTKNKAGEARIKFYLNPILSPAYQIPAAHTKEPLYWSVDRVMELAREALLVFALDKKPLDPLRLPLQDDPAQLRLFKEQ